jgi:hypothetical protein
MVPHFEFHVMAVSTLLFDHIIEDFHGNQGMKVGL